MADDKKSGWEEVKTRVKTLFNMPDTPAEEEQKQGKADPNKPYTPAIPVKKAPDKKPDEKQQQKAQPSSYSKGGKVRKTGMAKVHKGEKVLTVSQTKKLGGKKKSAARKRA